MIQKTTLVKWWLTLLATMVFLMVFIGGVTRLTDSGLSMTDWKPLMGSIPPLTESAWEQTFEKYKQYPEFKLINSEMSLRGFKKIFFWEYFHRLFGRLIGLAFFIPFLIFTLKKTFTTRQTKRYSIAFILGGMQGLLGWYMVKSGLVNKPDVSHFRLAAHLSLAFIIIGYIYWQLLELKFQPRKLVLKGGVLLYSFLGLLSLQIIYGAFVAGLKAGLTHNTFPKMGRHWIPNDLFYLAPKYINFFENPVLIQFTHRYLGIALFVFALALFFSLRKSPDFDLKRSAYGLGFLMIFQVALGIFTLVAYVPLWSASLHQLGACLLLLLTLRCIFFGQSKKLEMT